MNTQNLKIGDKLLCKEDCWIPDVNYHRGREYEVCNIKNEEDDLHNYSYVIIDRINNERLFIYDSELNFIFYTKKEHRRMKLKKINDEEAEY